MEKLFIVVEGDADECFFKALIGHHFEKIERDCVFVKAKTNGQSIKEVKIKEIITKTVNLEQDTIFILDADVPDYKGTLAGLIENFINEKITVTQNQVFLLPNSDQTGCLEDLLLELVMPRLAEPIFKCFESYKTCIHKIDSSYTKPNLKTKIFAYSEIVTGKGGEKQRNYEDENVWNLEHPNLNPLVDFLKPHFA